MINKLGFGFLRLPKKDGELDWQAICSMADAFSDGGGVFFDTCYPGDDWKIIPTYHQMVLSAGKASDCIGCHSCETHCPQKLTIAEHMKTIAKEFETSEA